MQTEVQEMAMTIAITINLTNSSGNSGMIYTSWPLRNGMKRPVISLNVVARIATEN
jgi:hypothetical protein